jgi:hypothetical protein
MGHQNQLFNKKLFFYNKMLTGTDERPLCSKSHPFLLKSTAVTDISQSKYTHSLSLSLSLSLSVNPKT